MNGERLPIYEATLRAIDKREQRPDLIKLILLGCVVLLVLAALIVGAA